MIRMQIIRFQYPLLLFITTLCLCGIIERRCIIISNFASQKPVRYLVKTTSSGVSWHDCFPLEGVQKSS